MKVYCAYNDSYDRFLKKVVKMVIKQYGMELHLETLYEVELKEISEFTYETDGRLESISKIIVTSRLYDLLPSLDLRKIKNNDNFKLILNTLLHEMGHVSDYTVMPNLYNCAMLRENKYSDVCSFWIEYIAEKRSQEMCHIDYSQFCQEFAMKKWEANKMNYYDADSSNFYYLGKVISYFMARTIDVNKRRNYFKIMSNPLLKEFLIEMEAEVRLLEGRFPFDDIAYLDDLYKIYNKFYKKFMCKYRE